MRKRLHRVFRFFSLVSFGALILMSLTSNASYARPPQDVTFGYCASDTGLPTVYFSVVFDLHGDVNGMHNAPSIANEFYQYLAGRFDYTTNSAYPAGCTGLDSRRGLAESTKQTLESQLRQQQKKIVEVPEWKYVPDETTIAQTHTQGAAGRISETPTHTFCLSDASQGAVYSAGPVNTVGNTNLSNWSGGFQKFLKEKYSYSGHMYCNFLALNEAKRLMNARFEGARAAGRKVVETGWTYSPATAASPSATSASTSGGERHAVCWAENHKQQTAYFGVPFVPAEGTVNQEWAKEFREFLISKYGGAGLVNCRVSGSASEAQQQKQTWMNNARARDKLVETGWAYGSAPTAAAPATSVTSSSVSTEAPSRSTKYAICWAENPVRKTAYFGAPFVPTEGTHNQEWSKQFRAFLAGKYGKLLGGSVSCRVTTSVAEAQQQTQTWMDHARTRDKLVETGWKFQ